MILLVDFFEVLNLVGMAQVRGVLFGGIFVEFALNCNYGFTSDGAVFAQSE